MERLSDTRVEGNLIGTDVTGTLPRGNGGAGIEIDGALGFTTIGDVGLGNVIADNSDGIVVRSLDHGRQRLDHRELHRHEPFGSLPTWECGSGYRNDRGRHGRWNPGPARGTCWPSIRSASTVSGEGTTATIRGQLDSQPAGLGDRPRRVRWAHPMGRQPTIRPTSMRVRTACSTRREIDLVNSTATTAVRGTYAGGVNATFTLDFYANDPADLGAPEAGRYLGSGTVATGGTGGRVVQCHRLGRYDPG